MASKTLRRTGRALLVLGLVAGCASAGVGPGSRGFDRKLARDQRAFEAADRDAFEVWSEQAESGDALAQSRLGLMYELGRGVPRNYAEAARWYRAAAMQDDCGGQYHLGLLHLRGRGVRLDLDLASYWIRLAADHASDSAELSFASLYLDPSGIPHDFAEASGWFLSAAGRGLAVGQYGMALLSRLRGGAPEESVEWLEKAANQGHPEAQYELARAYALGEGVDPDAGEAARWYAAAAEAGLPSAQRELGRAYRDGRGVPPAPLRAYAWLSLAAANGDAEAHHEMEAIEAGLSPHQLRAAQALADAHEAAATDSQ